MMNTDKSEPYPSHCCLLNSDLIIDTSEVNYSSLVPAPPPVQNNLEVEMAEFLEELSEPFPTPISPGKGDPTGRAVEQPSDSRAGDSQLTDASLLAHSTTVDDPPVDKMTKIMSPKPVIPPLGLKKVVSKEVPGPSKLYSSVLKQNVPRPSSAEPDASAPSAEDSVFFSIMRAKCLTTDLTSFSHSRLVAIDLKRVLGRADATNVSDMSNGAILIKTTTDVHRRALSSITVAGGVPVTVSPHP
jgi:hypothetical protein